MKQLVLLFVLIIILQYSNAQSTQNWHWKDYSTDSVHGISLKKAYEFLKTLPQKPSPIIVAVIDGGMDSAHQDIKKILWTNLKEIPNNQIDDDKNGYVDDIHGWNFLGGKDGRNINQAASEKSRIYHRYKSQFEHKIIDTLNLTKKDKDHYFLWKQTEAEMEVSENDLANLQYIKLASNALKKMSVILLKEITDTNFTAEFLETYQPLGRVTLDTKMAYLRNLKILGIDRTTPYPEIVNDLEEYINEKEKSAVAKETTPIDIRADIIKDQYFDVNDKYYGNNDITGPNARHGTHVGGLVASKPDSNWQVQDWYPLIKIMSIRAVPDGDEYDKDISIAIRYAVDNGAKIINMSFGKSFSPEQAWVDSAIRYAGQKGVLIVHSAGNEFYDLNLKSVYPNSYSPSFRDTAKNMITIGASSDAVINNSLLTSFSNYGNKVVDILSPGEKIYSTLPGNNKYGYLDGTSMSSPIVSHIAAMILSYFPTLTAVQVKEILRNSVWKPSNASISLPIPNRDTDKSLADISSTGGIVNAYNALQLAFEINKKNILENSKNPTKKSNKKINNPIK